MRIGLVFLRKHAVFMAATHVVLVLLISISLTRIEMRKSMTD